MDFFIDGIMPYLIDLKDFAAKIFAATKKFEYDIIYALL